MISFPCSRAVPFASLYVYSPCAAGGAASASRSLCALLKSGDGQSLRDHALGVREHLEELPWLSQVLGADATLVPVPGCACSDPKRRCVAEGLAAELHRAGVGRDVWPALRRVRPVRRSATAAPGRRPTVDVHFRSFTVDAAVTPPAHLVLVDDVITKGRTLLAAAARLTEAFPHCDIRAFALLRTLGYATRIEHLLDPCLGQIRWHHGDARRTP
jgi:hypothetical protein